MKKVMYILILIVGLSNLMRSQEEILTIKTATGSIEGTLLLPEIKVNVPLVIMIAGSGPTDRNGNQSELENNSLKMLAEGLAKNNIASLRYDKRGVGQSEDAGKDEMELRFDDLVNDASQWVDLMAKDKRFNSITIAGHSEGSLIGMLVAGKSKKVNAYVSIAGPGRPADEVIKEQLEIAPDGVKAKMFPMIDRIKKGDTINDVPRIYYAILRPSVQPYMHSWFKYNPAREIKKLKIPVLIVQGTTDIQVKVKDAELLANAQPKAQKAIITNMNHVLKTVESTEREAQKPSYSDGSIPINEEVVRAISNFVLNAVGTLKK